ncbi:MAG: DHH family phosphoesterase [Sulfurovum sp.]|nr:DHH family phosphoesterase [Sulfurovum sp.]
MYIVQFPAEEVKKRIEIAQSISIVTHLNPDADTLGTGLGIYALLKHYTSKHVEIVNASEILPSHLDFLPFFARIKQKIEFKESLIIGCDCGSIDRFGFDLQDREIINIDHHASNKMYGTVNVVYGEYASASQVAYHLFKPIYPITAESATCFYAALLSDTLYFTTTAVDEEVFQVAQELIGLGADPVRIATNFTQRRSLASLRILERALHSLSLYRDGRVALLQVTPEDIEATGSIMSDMDGLVDYACSLAVVEIAVLLIGLADGTLRVSLRSKRADVAKVAGRFGGGGHKVAAGFILKDMQMQETIDTILEEISILGLIDD